MVSLRFIGLSRYRTIPAETVIFDVDYYEVRWTLPQFNEDCSPVCAGYEPLILKVTCETCEEECLPPLQASYCDQFYPESPAVSSVPLQYNISMSVYSIRSGTERLKDWVLLRLVGENAVSRFCYDEPISGCGIFNILPLTQFPDGIIEEIDEIALRADGVTGDPVSFSVYYEGLLVKTSGRRTATDTVAPPATAYDCYPKVPRTYACTDEGPYLGCAPETFWIEAVPREEPEWDLPPLNQVDPQWIDENLVRVVTVVGFAYSTSTETGSFYTSPRMAIGLGQSAGSYQQMPNYINGYWRSNINFVPYTNGYPTECGMVASYLPTANDSAMTKYFDGPAPITWDWTQTSLNFFENGNFRNTPQQTCKFGTFISWPNIDHFVFSPSGTLLYKIEIGGAPNPYPQNGPPGPTQCNYTIRTLLTFNIDVPITVRLVDQTELQTAYTIRVAEIAGPIFQFNGPDVPNVVLSLTATATSAGISILLDRAFDAALSSTFPIIGTILAQITNVDINFNVEKSCN